MSSCWKWLWRGVSGPPCWRITRFTGTRKHRWEVSSATSTDRVTPVPPASQKCDQKRAKTVQFTPGLTVIIWIESILFADVRRFLKQVPQQFKGADADVALKELLRGTDPAGLAAAQCPHEATDSRWAGVERSTRRRETASVQLLIIFNKICIRMNTTIQKSWLRLFRQDVRWLWS